MLNNWLCRLRFPSCRWLVVNIRRILSQGKHRQPLDLPHHSSTSSTPPLESSHTPHDNQAFVVPKITICVVLHLPAGLSTGCSSTKQTNENNELCRIYYALLPPNSQTPGRPGGHLGPNLWHIFRVYSPNTHLK
jgi:hypothetical protein